MYLWNDNEWDDEWDDEEKWSIPIALQRADIDEDVENFLKKEQVNRIIYDIYFTQYASLERQVESMPVYVREIMKKKIEELKTHKEFAEEVYEDFRYGLAYDLEWSRKIQGQKAMIDLGYFYKRELDNFRQSMLCKIRDAAKTAFSLYVGSLRSEVNCILENEDDSVRLALLEWLIRNDTSRGLACSLRIPRTSVNLKKDIDRLLNVLGFVPVT